MTAMTAPRWEVMLSQQPFPATQPLPRSGGATTTAGAPRVDRRAGEGEGGGDRGVGRAGRGLAVPPAHLAGGVRRGRRSRAGFAGCEAHVDEDGAGPPGGSGSAGSPAKCWSSLRGRRRSTAVDWRRPASTASSLSRVTKDAARVLDHQLVGEVHPPVGAEHRVGRAIALTAIEVSTSSCLSDCAVAGRARHATAARAQAIRWRVTGPAFWEIRRTVYALSSLSRRQSGGLSDWREGEVEGPPPARFIPSFRKGPISRAASRLPSASEASTASTLSASRAWATSVSARSGRRRCRARPRAPEAGADHALRAVRQHPGDGDHQHVVGRLAVHRHRGAQLGVADDDGAAGDPERVADAGDDEDQADGRVAQEVAEGVEPAVAEPVGDRQRALVEHAGRSPRDRPWARRRRAVVAGRSR